MESKTAMTAMQQMCNHIQNLSGSMMINGGNLDAEKLKWFIEQTKDKATELRDTVEKEQMAHYESILKEKEEENRKLSERSVDIMFENGELKCREKRLVEALKNAQSELYSINSVYGDKYNAEDHSASLREIKQLLTEIN